MWAARAEIAETEMEKKKREMENAKNEYEKTKRVVEEKKKVVESLRRCQRIKEREAAYAKLAAIEAEERNEMANQAKRAERRTELLAKMNPNETKTSLMLHRLK